MKEKLKGIWEKIKTGFGKLSKKVRLLLLISVLVTLAVLIAVAVTIANRPYAVLFTGLSAEDTSSILSYLDESGTADYRVQNNDTILVPENQEAQWKAKLLMEGYPKSGFAYSTYLDNIGSLSTESDRQTALLFDLQDRMGSVIRCLEGVKNAWVTISPAEDRRYVLDSDNMLEASASVLVETSGERLTTQQAAAIRNLVARAVKGLTIDNISISDTLGNTYGGGDSASADDSSRLKLALEEQVNNTVRTNVMQVLTPFFGQDNIRVGVNSTVDISHSVGNTTTYTQPEWAADGSTNGRGIIGSRVYDNVVTRDNANTTGGVAGTESNSDISTYVENQLNPDGSERTISSSGQEDYNVDTRQEQTERTAGIVTDVMISVSLNSTAVSSISADTLMDHVARAAGIAPDLQRDKISILTLPFFDSTEPAPDSGLPVPMWVIYAAAGTLVALLVLFLVIFLIRRKRRAAAEEMEEDELFQPSLFDTAPEPATVGADITNLQTEKSMELRKGIRDFADKNPEIAAQMVKAWLRGEEGNNG